MRLKDKVAIITGAGGGIGRSIAEGFLREGARVFMIDRLESRERPEVSHILSRHADKAFFMGIDITMSKDVDQMASEVFDQFHKIDILVNCAGIYEDRMMLDMSDSEWDRILRVNLYACFYCSRAVASYMKDQCQGSIINISSFGGQAPPSIGHAHYAASKSGMIGFARAIATELAPYRVRVNNICPGPTEDTPMGDRAIKNVGQEFFKKVPLGRPATPMDIAFGAIYLASEEASYLTGVSLNINGGVLMN